MKCAEYFDVKEGALGFVRRMFLFGVFFFCASFVFPSAAFAATQAFPLNSTGVLSNPGSDGSGWTFYSTGQYMNFAFVGTDVDLRIYLNSSSDTLDVTVDDVTTNVSLGSVASTWVTRRIISGLSDGYHSVHIAPRGSVAIDGPGGIIITGSAPSIDNTVAYLDAFQYVNTISGTMGGNFGDAWGTLNGEIGFDVVGGRQLFLRVFRNSSPGAVTYSINSSSTSVADTGGSWQWVMMDNPIGSAGRRAVTAGSGGTHILYRQAGNPLIAVRYRPSESVPTMKAYSGQNGFPAEVGSGLVDDPLVAFTSNGSAVRDLSISAMTTSSKVYGLMLQNGAKYSVGIDGVYGSVQSLVSDAQTKWIELYNGASGNKQVTVVSANTEGTNDGLMLSALKGTTSTQITNLSSPRKTVVFIGDSITNSIRAGTDYPDSSNGFAYKLSKALNLSVANIGIPYRKVSDAPYTITGIGTVDLVNIMIGTNDIGVTSIPTFQANYVTLLNNVLTTHPSAKVLCHTISRSTIPTTYNDAIIAAIAAVGSPRVSLYDDAANIIAGDLMGDGVHFSIQGYDNTVSRWTPLFQNLLDTTPPSISSVASSTSATTSSVTWTTNESSTSTVEYGSSTAYGSSSSSALSVTSHSISLTGLTENTQYHFRVLSQDTAGNVATSTDYTFRTRDATPPSISAFTIPSTSDSLTVPISSFSVTDNDAVTGYIVTEVSGAPSSGDAGWTSSAPTSYIATSQGSKTLYAWAKDAEGNVSTSMSATVVINTTPPSTGGGAATIVPAGPQEIYEAGQRTVLLQSLNEIHIPTNTLIKLTDDWDPKTKEDTVVYYIGTDGRRHIFPNENIYRTWYVDFSNIKSVSLKDLASIPLGDNVRYKPGVKMVKFQTDPKCYAVSGQGILRWVKTEQVAIGLYGSNWSSQIDDLSDAFFMNYSFGETIFSTSQFNVENQRDMAGMISETL